MSFTFAHPWELVETRVNANRGPGSGVLLAPGVGLEPTTLRLTAVCSAN